MSASGGVFKSSSFFIFPTSGAKKRFPHYPDNGNG
jgi:hypothetical protein